MSDKRIVKVYTETGVEEISCGGLEVAFEYAIEIMRSRVFWVQRTSGEWEFLPVRKVKVL